MIIEDTPRNMIKKMEGYYYISYNPFSEDYGSSTTAIVFDKFGSTFLILGGNHFNELIKSKNPVDYYIDNINLSHRYSDSNYLILKESNDDLSNAFVKQNINNLEFFYKGSVEILKNLKKGLKV